MRSLHKLRHRQPLAEDQRERYLRERIDETTRRDLGYRTRRAARFVLPFAVLALVVFGVARISGALDSVAGALVEVDETVFTAPARVRVAEVLVDAGARCRAGDPLVRLEAVDGDEAVAVAELEIERARLRLEWFDAGGELAPHGEVLRGDRAQDAQREAELAEGELLAARARVLELERDRDRLSLALAAEERRRAGQVEVIGEELAGARANADQARERVEASRADARTGALLAADGIAPRRDRERLESTERIEESAALTRDAQARALVHQLTTATDAHAIEARADAATLARADAALESARFAVASLERRAELWRTSALRHGELDPDAPLDAVRLRSAARALHENELRLARARRDQVAREQGQCVVVAPADGFVSWVAVEPGSVVDAGAELVRVQTASLAPVVAYASPELARGLEVGRRCRLVREDGGRPIEGRVVSIGARWVERPARLAPDRIDVADLRVPIRIELLELLALPAGARLDVVFGSR